jgi:hypothetical protein
VESFVAARRMSLDFVFSRFGVEGIFGVGN